MPETLELSDECKREALNVADARDQTAFYAKYG